MLFELTWDEQATRYLDVWLFRKCFNALGGVAQVGADVKTGDQANPRVGIHDLQVGIQPTRQEEHIVIRVGDNLTWGSPKDDLQGADLADIAAREDQVVDQTLVAQPAQVVQPAQGSCRYRRRSNREARGYGRSGFPGSGG